MPVIIVSERHIPKSSYDTDFGIEESRAGEHLDRQPARLRRAWDEHADVEFAAFTTALHITPIRENNWKITSAMLAVRRSCYYHTNVVHSTLMQEFSF